MAKLPTLEGGLRGVGAPATQPAGTGSLWVQVRRDIAG